MIPAHRLPRHVLLAMLACGISLAMSGCVEYATVYVDVKDRVSGTSTSMDAYAADSGLYLGETPLSVDKTRSALSRRPLFSVVVKGDCYQSQWRLVKIDNWASSYAQAQTPSKQNVVRMYTRKIPGCP